MGNDQTSRHVCVTSVIPLRADIHQRGLLVRFMQKADNQVAFTGCCVPIFNLAAVYPHPEV